MKKRGLLFWLPRLISVLFIVFVSYFAFDGIRNGLPILESLSYFLPTILLIIILLFACRHEFMGGILFVVLALVYLSRGWNFPWQAKLVICLPLFVIGCLFILNSLKMQGGEMNGMQNKKSRKKTSSKKDSKKEKIKSPKRSSITKKTVKKKTAKKKTVKRKTAKKKSIKRKTTKRR